jgi:hypothetical protein
MSAHCVCNTSMNARDKSHVTRVTARELFCNLPFTDILTPCLRSKSEGLSLIVLLAHASPWQKVAQAELCLLPNLPDGNVHTALLLVKIRRLVLLCGARSWYASFRMPPTCLAYLLQRPKGILKPSNQADQTQDTTQDISDAFQNISPTNSLNDSELTGNMSSAVAAEFHTNVHDNQSRKSFGGRRVSFAAHAHVRYVLGVLVLKRVSLRRAGAVFSHLHTKTQLALLPLHLRQSLPPPSLLNQTDHHRVMTKLLQMDEAHIALRTRHRHPRAALA